MNQERIKRRLAAIMVADVAGYSRLMEANEEGTLRALQQHRREFFDPMVARHDGRIFKAMGDGFLVEFASALDAAQCAVEIQRGMTARNADTPEDRRIRFRIGINLGDVIVHDNDFHGEDVSVAERLMSLASPGGITCSAGIRHQIGSRLPLGFSDLGERELKNIIQPVHVFTIEPPADATPPAKARPGETAPPAVQRDKPSVGVLPFVNMSGDPEQEFFSDGITEDIITDLSKVDGLFVLSRNAVFRQKGKAADMEQIGRELGVAFLLHGSVRKAGARVRVTAHLTEGASGRQIWAERYDRDLTDIFALQDEITAAIVDQLQVKLLPPERKAIAESPTDSVEAYTQYLMGRDYFHRGTRSSYLMARRMFAKAIEIDPRYARAYAGLADCDAFLYMDYSDDVADAVLENSEKALALQDTLIEAHASRGLALSIARRYEESDRAFAYAMERNPNHFELRFFMGRAAYAQGKLRETAVHWERAAEINPDDYQSLILLHQVYTSLNDFVLATRAAIRGVERAERAYARSPDNPRPAYLIATTLAKLGGSSRAEEWARIALEIGADDYLTQYNVACYHAVSGNRDEAFAMIERLLPVSNAEMREWILQDSDLDPLHGDPRWRMVVEAVEQSAR